VHGFFVTVSCELKDETHGKFCILLIADRFAIWKKDCSCVH